MTITNREITDVQIMKALECCSHDGGGDWCSECPLVEQKCAALLPQKALDLINRQRAEIEALKMDNAQLQSDIINANQSFDHIKKLWEAEKEKVAKAKQKVVYACKMIKTARAEAIEDFAERLKAQKIAPEFPWDDFVVTEGQIDELVEEMTEGKPCTEGVKS